MGWDISCNTFRQQHRLQKRVSFAVYNNRTYDVLHVGDYSYHELTSTWFTAEELRELKRKSKQDIAASERGDQNVCLRGLEVRKSTIAKRKRKQKKADHRFAVMQEQFKQKTLGRIEPERLALASQSLSEYCRREAKNIGHQDEQAAISIIMEGYKKETLCGYDCTRLLLVTQAA